MNGKHTKRKNSIFYFRKWLAFLLIAICMAGMFPAQTYADSIPKSVKGSKSSVMQVVVCYQDEDGTRYTLQTGSCFLINKNTAATCCHVTQMSSEEISEVARIYHISTSKVKENVKIGIVYGNTWIDTTVSCSNEKLDLAMLHLSDNLSSSKDALKLRKSTEMNRQEKCYAVGYPGTEAKYDTGIVEKAVITKGKVTRLVSFLDNPGYYYLENTARIVSGDSGGALLDQYGFVVGVIKAVGMNLDGTENYYAVTTNEVLKMLEKNNISYTRDSREEHSEKGILYQITDYNKKTAWVEDSYKYLQTASIKSSVTIDGRSYKVTAIKKNAFKNRKYLRKVTIGKNVTQIGSRAFYGCRNLKQMTINSDKLNIVSTKAIKGIYKKAKIRVPKGKAASYRKMFSRAGGVKSGMKFTAK